MHWQRAPRGLGFDNLAGPVGDVNEGNAAVALEILRRELQHLLAAQAQKGADQGRPEYRIARLLQRLAEFRRPEG